MKFLDNIVLFIIQLDRKKFLIYALSAFISTLLIGCGISYYIYNKETNLIYRIQVLQKLSHDSQQTAFAYETIQQRKRQILNALEHEKNFDLKSFFASFCKENNLKPESTWNTTIAPIEGNELLEEISLQATFTRFSMQKLVNFVETLHQKELVYIKDITIRKNTSSSPLENKSLAFDISVATLAFKQEKGE